MDTKEKGQLLILDSTFAIMPIRAAGKKQYNVITVGNRPDAEFYSDVDNCHLALDYGDISLIKSYLTTQKFNLIVPGCTDISLNTYASIMNERKEFIKEVSSKDAFSEFSKKFGLRSPQEFNFDQKFDFPVIVKPSDSYSGRGITVVGCISQLNAAITFAKKHSRSNSFVIQEYIDGQLYSVSCFRDFNGRTMKFVVEEHCNQHDYSVDQSFVVQPDETWSDSLQDVINRILLGSPEFVKFFHLQFIVRHGEVYCLEMFLRCPGDLYGHLVSISTGIDYGALYIAAHDCSINLGAINETMMCRKVRRLTLKTDPGREVEHPAKYPNRCIQYIKTLNTGYKNTGALPIRHGVVFEDVEYLFNDKDVYKIYKG